MVEQKEGDESEKMVDRGMVKKCRRSSRRSTPISFPFVFMASLFATQTFELNYAENCYLTRPRARSPFLSTSRTSISQIRESFI